MITVNPIKFNNSRKYISFKEGNLNNLTPNVAILPLQNTNAKINFEKDLQRTIKADAVQSNPLTALGYKFVKTYNILFSPENNKPKNDHQHISFMG